MSFKETTIDQIVGNSSSYAGMFFDVDLHAAERMSWYNYFDDFELYDNSFSSSNWTKTAIGVGGSDDIYLHNSSSAYNPYGMLRLDSDANGTPNTGIVAQLDGGLGVDGPVYYLGDDGTGDLSPAECFVHFSHFSEHGESGPLFIGLSEHWSVDQVLPTTSQTPIVSDCSHVGFYFYALGDRDDTNRFRFSASNSSYSQEYITEYLDENNHGSSEDNKINEFGFRVVSGRFIEAYMRFLGEAGGSPDPWTKIYEVELPQNISEKMFLTVGYITEATSCGNIDFISFGIKRDRRITF